MRHFFSLGTIAAHTDRVAAPPAQARLVAPARRPQAVSPRPRRAGAGAVALATITVAAHHNLDPATGTKKATVAKFAGRLSVRGRQDTRRGLAESAGA